MILAPDVETRPAPEQFRLDDASYRSQLGYLLECSPLYRQKLAEAGVNSAPAAGGLAQIADLPLTDKQELRDSCTPENPVGEHLCAEPSEIVRIYSTSGTTGVPSYVPLTAGDLDNWITGSARSYAASGVSSGQRIVSTYNAGPFVAGAALASFDRIGACLIPVGTGNTERLVLAMPLPVSVELARDQEGETVLAEAIRQKLRDVLVVQTRVDLVPWGSLPRSEYKSKLVKRQ